jgi:hypothetical protein
VGSNLREQTWLQIYGAAEVGRQVTVFHHGRVIRQVDFPWWAAAGWRTEVRATGAEGRNGAGAGPLWEGHRRLLYTRGYGFEKKSESRLETLAGLSLSVRACQLIVQIDPGQSYWAERERRLGRRREAAQVGSKESTYGESQRPWPPARRNVGFFSACCTAWRHPDARLEARRCGRTQMVSTVTATALHRSISAGWC